MSAACQALHWGLGPAWGRAHARSCLGGTPSPARRPTGKSRKPSPAESGFGGKDSGFGRNAVAGSSAPGHVTRPREPKFCHSARREPCVSGGRGGGMEGEAGRRSREAPGTRRRTRRARGLREAAFPRPPRGTGWAGRGAGGARRELGWRAQRPPYGKRAAWLRPPEGACRGPGARHCLPLPGAARGAGAGRGRRCGGPSAGGPGEGRGRGAWLRSALQCGGGNRFQSVLLLAQRALLAPGSERSLSRLNPPPERSLPAGGLAGRGPERGSGEPLLGRCEAQAPQNPSPGAGVRVSWSLVSSPLTLAEVASLLILSFPARLRSPPPGSPLQKAGLGTSGAPTSSGVGDRLSNHAEPSGQGGWGHVSLHLPVGCCHPHCPRLCQARHPRLACCRTPWCLQPLPTPGSCPQLRQAWRESPGLGPMGRWQPTSVSGS